jgi:hypothetical protein
VLLVEILYNWQESGANLKDDWKEFPQLLTQAQHFSFESNGLSGSFLFNENMAQEN